MKNWRRACILLCAFTLALNAWHIVAQKAPPAWDDGWYLEWSFKLFFALKKGLWDFAAAYADAFKLKAPLISVLPIPVYAFLGPTERHALWVNEAALALTLWWTCRIGRRLYGDAAGWAAAAAVGLVPIIYGLSRFFYPETVLLALVTWSLLIILEADKDRGAGWKLGLALGLGLLTKVSFPAFLIGPVWLRRRELRPHCGRILAVGGVVAATWYAFNAPYVLGHALSSGFGSISKDYGMGASSLAGLMVFFSQMVFHALSWPYALAAAVLLLLAWGPWWLKPGSWRMTEPARFLLAWAALPVILVLLAGNRQVRYLAPVLPALAVVLGAAAAELGKKRAGRVLLAILTLAPLTVLSSQTLGVPSPRTMFFNGPPTADRGWDRGALIDAVAAAFPDGSVIGVGLEYGLLNANNISSLSASRGLGYGFVNLNQGNRTAEDAAIRLKDKAASGLILFEGALPADLDTAYDFLNRANARVREMVASGRIPAVRLAEVSVEPGITAVLYRLGGRP
ncbi:MAG: glycosyltransferase family 39 protein [Elusimicrobiota bacterium]|jgi:4-amino-4-deoxy-L-arabinose transferase-like glycosyltransferase